MGMRSVRFAMIINKNKILKIGQKINEKVRLVWPKNLGEIKNWEPKKMFPGLA